MARLRVRIEADGHMGRTAHVYVVDERGERLGELPVTCADVAVSVDDVNRATLEVLLVEGHFNAELERLAISHVGRRRWRLRKLWSKVRSSL